MSGKTAEIPWSSLEDKCGSGQAILVEKRKGGKCVYEISEQLYDSWFGKEVNEDGVPFLL